MGYYRGIGSTMAREGLALAVYFSFYQKIQSLVPNANQYVLSLVVGGFAGLASWWITYPLDLIKTNIQVDLKTTFRY